MAATAQVTPGPKFSAPTFGNSGRCNASIAPPIVRGDAQNARRFVALTRRAARPCRCFAVVGRAFACLPAGAAGRGLPGGGAAAGLVVACLAVASRQQVCDEGERDRAQYGKSHANLLPCI